MGPRVLKKAEGHFYFFFCLPLVAFGFSGLFLAFCWPWLAFGLCWVLLAFPKSLVE